LGSIAVLLLDREPAVFKLHGADVDQCLMQSSANFKSQSINHLIHGRAVRSNAPAMQTRHFQMVLQALSRGVVQAVTLAAY
jgi:hypothetical protein